MVRTEHRWFHRRGDLARDGWESVVDDTNPGWHHTGLRVAALTGEGALSLDDRALERIVIPLAGSFEVVHAGRTGHTGHAGHTDSVRTLLTGRRSVFDGPTDVLYLPAGTTASVHGVGRVAVAEAPASAGATAPWRHLRADEVPVELRGAGRSSRQVHNFGTPGVLAAQKLIVCEVITPAENWSSYPPHKHDEHRPGHESRLEEIYYFEAARARGAEAGADTDAFGMFSTYSSPAGQIDINAMVRTGDIALVPYGYHGPAVAAPGYDLYYLNVMAGPDPEREWLISDDPAHAWVRETWNGQHADERLPYTGEGGQR